MLRVRVARGQAILEMALSLMLFVTVLMFAIHFAEVGYLSVKVTEAAHSAALDAPGYELHRWPNNAKPARQAVATAASRAQARYQDFDSRTEPLGRRSLTQVFTSVSDLAVRCEAGRGLKYSPHPMAFLAYTDADGLRCQSEARITAFGIPTFFLEGGEGFFEVPHYKQHPFRVCGMGRARHGGCPPGLAMMLDDWGLAGERESGQCFLIPNVPIPCKNKPFWLMSASIFTLNGMGQGIAASSMASSLKASPVVFPPGGENVFWMSSVHGMPYGQPLPSEGWKLWPTTPGPLPGGFGGIPYTIAYFQRDKCFLGKDC